MSDQNNTQNDIFKAGMNAAKPFEIEGVPAVLVPENAKVMTFENLLTREKPLRTAENRTMRTAQEFLNYYNRFANEESTIYVHVDSAKFKGVIDHYGPADDTDNQDHTVTYTCPETPEWQQWKANSGSWMSQEELSEFLLDHNLQIVKPTPEQFHVDEHDVVFDKLPDGAQMVQIANTLQVSSQSAITSGRNTHNGALKFEFNEEINGSAGQKGEFEIPTYFVIGVQLFKEGRAYLILCRFRYRKDGSRLRLQYELVRPHKTHDHAVRDVIEHIKHGKPVLDEQGNPTNEIQPGTFMATGYIYEIV